jgi:hypothetical protein
VKTRWAQDFWQAPAVGDKSEPTPDAP